MHLRIVFLLAFLALVALPAGSVRAADQFLITEFAAANSGTLVDEDGDSSDWIEIHNPGTNTASLAGWFLTDNSLRLGGWQFPATNVPPSGYLVVFASGKDRRRPGSPLHTDFRLGSTGGYLALVRPDGFTIASEFSPAYPIQVGGVSYGSPVQTFPVTLVASGALARVRVPLDGSLGEAWTLPGFADALWTALPTGVGYEADDGASVPVLLANSVTEFSGTQGQASWFYGYWNKSGDANGIYTNSEFTAFPAGTFNGTAWDLPGDPPFTQLSAAGARPTAPDGNPGNPEHWVIRRYVNEFNGPVTITATVTHTSDWIRVTQTGTASSSFLYIYLIGTGEGNIDDLQLVAGTTAGVGANTLLNGDFEGGDLTGWNVSANLAGSYVDSTIKRGGARSLRLVSSAGGTTQGSSIWQQITPALTASATYTLSYWYLPATNSSTLVTRLSGGGINVSPIPAGDGVIARVLVDGQSVFAQSVAIAQRTLSVLAPAQLGSHIDLAIDPGPAGSGVNDAVAFSATVQSANPNLAPIASSVADWSTGGQPGYNGWFYGYYNRTTDPDDTYAASDFIPFPRDSGPPSPGNFWDGDEYKWFSGEPPWTRLGQYWMHPNGTNNSAEHWPIRRWVSKAAGSVTIEWDAHKEAIDQNNGGGTGVTVRVFHNGVLRDSSYIAGADVFGVQRTLTVDGVSVGDTFDFAVDPTGSAGRRDDAADRTFFTAVLRGQPSLAGTVQSSLEGAMRNVNASAYVRLAFDVENPAQFNALVLRLKYDDGFVAYLNGEEVARANAPATPAWNGTATGGRSDAVAAEYEEFNLGSALGLLQPGPNVLAIHGLNLTAGDGDFLILPELIATTTLISTNEPRYFNPPTPGAPNGVGTTTLGPLVTSPAHSPNVPLDAQDLVITTRVSPTVNPVASVRLVHRTMYGAETVLNMLDDGLHDDGAAADGVYGARIPAAASTNGQMVRWYISATDTANNATRFPPFPDPKGSAQYLGTVVANPVLTNLLPVVQMFVQNTTLTTNRNGTRCSVFWDGELYDNVEVGGHGQTTWYVFPKRSMNVNLNRDHQFQWSPGEKRVKAFDLLSPYADKAYLRLVLAFEATRDAGVPTHRTRPVRLEMNGAFNSVMQMVEQSNDEMLERNGLDPEGAFYKIYFPLTNAYSGARKETRKQEANDDLAGLIAGINLNGTALRSYVFDNIDVPEVVNFMAAINLVQNEDCCWYKNYFLYRDTRNTGEWQVMPWDMDLTFGRTFVGGSGGGYFNTAIWWTNAFWSQDVGTRDFIGTGIPGYGRTVGDAVLLQPEGMAMFLRRWSTVQETFLGLTNVHPLARYFEPRVDQLAAQITPDSWLDLAKWGTWSPSQSLAQAVTVLKDQYYAPRRGWIFDTLRFANGGPYLGPQPTNAILRIAEAEVSPASGNQAQEYIRLVNPSSVSLDLSGWRLSGDVQFTFKPGTVIASNGSLYVSPDVKAFRARSTGPRGGQGLFVQGPYRGQLSTRGGSLLLSDPSGRSVATTNLPPTPSLAQQYLRVTEIMYSPAATPGLATNADEFEYIEVRNTGPVTLSLAGVRFANGIDFNFSGSAVTSLAPGARALVVRNPAAFQSRYGTLPGLVAGSWSGQLDNAGENLLLLDAAGEKILDFSYNNAWYPITDGFGFSLVIVNDAAPWNTWDQKASWRPSGGHRGSPGQADPASSPLPRVLVTEVLSASTPPATDAIELFNDSLDPVNVGGWFVTDDFRNPFKYRIPDNTIIPDLGYLVLTEAAFNPTNPPSPTAFAFSSSGDEAYLFSANAAGELTGYYHGWTFGAADPGTSFGYHVNSTGAEQFVAQRALSLGADNLGPRVGPVVLSEIHYHPPDRAGGADNTADEFVELLNISDTPVLLQHPTLPTNTWRLQGGLDYAFPAGTSLAPGQRLLVAGFNPADPALLASFRARLGVPAGVPVLGPFSGSLNNAGDRVTLAKPGLPDQGIVPAIVIDQIDYTDAAPWPAGADGTGASLQRRTATAYGNDPANWLAGFPGAGAATGGGTPPVIVSQPASTNGAVSGESRFSVIATGAGPLGYHWRFNGSFIPGATNSTLILPYVQPANAGSYNVAVYNAAGVTESSNATLGIIYAAYFTQQPQSASVTAGASVLFSAQAVSSSPIAYQWRFNGANIPGATNSSLTLINVQPANAGSYQVVATDSVAPVVSAPALLSVNVRPVLTVTPVSQNAAPGSVITLSVSVSNSATLPLGFRWRRNGTSITNGMQVLNDYTCFFTVTNTASASYNVIVTNIATGASGTVSPNATITVVADSDADGLTDDWETALFGSPTAANPAADSDGDSLSNQAEYLAGTNPLDPASYLKVDGVAAPTPAGRVLTFGAVSNRTYTIQFSIAPAGAPWSRLADLPAYPTNTVHNNLLHAAPGDRFFYRVVTPRQP
ncbi:MAG: hypothetical protein RJA22_300 [Verrucomicrobiota bacterium]